MKTLTIFTPTFNRAHTLIRTYDSLCRQTLKDFEWLIVDDGSTDNTHDIINKWKQEANFEINYIYKENGGLHTGYNVAIQNINTELCMCCDSDDYLPDNAVEIICDTWKRYGSDKLAGIIGLDYISDKNIPIGGPFPEPIYKTYHFLDITPKLKHRGDIKMVHRTEILKPHVPMPTIAGEKNFNPIYIFMKVDPSLEYIILNKNLCFVDYQPTGMSANIFYQFRNSPHSFAELRKLKLGHPRVSLKRKFLDAAHLVSSALIAKDFTIFNNTPQRWLCALAAPLGFIIYLLILLKTRKKR